MEIKYKLYPYPVLWNKNDDYKMPSEFSAEIKTEENFKNTKLKIKFFLKDKEIEKLIRENKAEYVVHIEGTRTYFRDFISTRETEITYDLKDRDILGKLEINFFILAKQDIRGYRNDNFNEDYSSEAFNLKKGNIIAIADGYRFDIEKNDDELGKISSIFSICKKETVEQTGMTVDMSYEKIRIGLNITDYVNYSQLSQNPNKVDSVNSIIIFPALIYIFEQLKKDFTETDYTEYKWFRALENIFKKNGQELNKELLENEISIDLAQRVLNYPIERAFNSLTNEDEGDDEE
ncbi:hypothetical protein [Fusobacterium periodonticum]|jgi:hypothetical protein|uniref:hypothetical protein n=1 Tax=Fusobacterium periodonticum TaxID=860 RepID=UPI001956BA9D|nr:hypothetical protein [Fusobacterium periodonticum]MDU2234938.1 hypothetical protein [Fusobacterium periodonticum]VTX86737.1 Uncharacterised protein [Fusobacterium periodonticum]